MHLGKVRIVDGFSADDSCCVIATMIRNQTQNMVDMLEAAGDRAYVTLGRPEDNLSAAGNARDVARTNALWLLDAIAMGMEKVSPESMQENNVAWPAFVPEDGIPDIEAFLAPRDTSTVEDAITELKQVNDYFAACVEESMINDDDVGTMTFYGEKTYSQLLMGVIDHGGIHLGQAYAILKALDTGGKQYEPPVAQPLPLPEDIAETGAMAALQEKQAAVTAA